MSAKEDYSHYHADLPSFSNDQEDGSDSVWVKVDAEYACLYALDVIKGRFLEAEPVIATDPQYAYRYARDVIKDRFPEAESVIKNSAWKDDYNELMEELGIKFRLKNTWFQRFKFKVLSGFQKM